MIDWFNAARFLTFCILRSMIFFSVFGYLFRQSLCFFLISLIKLTQLIFRTARNADQSLWNWCLACVRPSVCWSFSPGRRMLLRRVCCRQPGGQEIPNDRCTADGSTVSSSRGRLPIRQNRQLPKARHGAGARPVHCEFFLYLINNLVSDFVTARASALWSASQPAV